MTVVVTDSSVLIPLDCGQLAHFLTTIGMDVRLSCLTIRCEMRSLLADNPGLTHVEEKLSKHEVRELQALKSEYIKLSLPDISSFLVARRLGAILLTDDEDLVDLSTERDVRCEGLVWCMDMMEAGGVDLSTLAAGIAKIQVKEPNNSREELGGRRDRYEALADAQARSARRAGIGRNRAASTMRLASSA